MGVPNMDHTAPGANCDALKAFGHASNFVFVVVHYADKRVRAPQQNFSILMTGQE